MSNASTDEYLLHGAPAAAPVRRTLRAGSWSVEFDEVAGDLRYLRLGAREVVRRIYAAVRDRNWGTVPGVLSDLAVEEHAAGFRIRYTSTHRQAEIHFVWRAEIAADADGSLRFGFDGEALSTFLRNRIGFCVLHPIRECAGAPCRTRLADGAEREASFPGSVAAEQPVKGLHDLAGLAHEVEPGTWAELRFTGDVFETEDQRNWIDASFKTYSTPLRLPFPVEIRPGSRVRQEVSLRLARREPGDIPTRADRPASPAFTEWITDAGSTRPDHVVVSPVTDAPARRFPALGLGMASHAEELEDAEVDRLRALRPAHLRVDLHLRKRDAAADRLARAVRQAERLGTRLELALHLDDPPDPGLEWAARALGEQPDRWARVLVLQHGQLSTPAPALTRAREVLGQLGVPLGGGTNADLYQLQLHPPPADADFAAWSMNPQVHASDDASLVETPEAAACQVESMRRRFPGLPLAVSPITLKPRFNPVATGAEPAVLPGELPPQVDPRQRSLLGAGWTVAMLAALAGSGVESLTFFETTGWRGVLETASGSPLPDRFPSLPGEVFPLYHVLAECAAFAGGELVPTSSNAPLAVASLLLRRGDHRIWLLANLGPETRTVVPRGGPFPVLARALDLTRVRQASVRPEAFRASARPWADFPEPNPTGDAGVLQLPPYGLLFLSDP